MIEILTKIHEALNPHGGADAATLWAGFGGAALGAVVGGLIQAALIWLTFRHEKRQRQRGLALRAMFTASIIHSDITSTKGAIDASLQRANEAGLSGQPVHRRVNSIVGLMPAKQLDTDVLAPFLEARELSLVHRYVEMHLKFEALSDMILAFNERSTRVRGMLGEVVASEDGTLVVDASLEGRLAPIEMELASLISFIRPALQTLELASRSVNLDLGIAARKYFRDKHFPKFVPDELAA
ncbi:hypothetical protein NKH14_22565 [Mesorhizobium sp. M1380]|uniref:hypothetical protein n=1 Tax=Mesorhizobium sp. M1380 TaxID=2957093 RepID=UPI00333AF55B